MFEKEDTCGLSLSCCWRVYLFCSHVSSFYVEASLQRDGGSVTAPHSVPSQGFNKQYWVMPSLAAVLLRQRSYLAVKAREITLLSVLGWREVWELRGAAGGGSEGKASIRSWSLHPGWPAAAKPVWCCVFSLSKVSAAQGLYWALALSFPVLQAA